jgi:hypothetical protein
MIKKGRAYSNNIDYINIYFLSKELFYLIPTIQIDTNPIGNKFIAFRFYLFNLVIQINL